MMRGHRGFAVPVALALVALSALLAADALQGAGTSLAVASGALERQRAFEAAETGLARTLQSLDAGERPAPVRHLPLDAGGRVELELKLDLVETLPEDFSVGRIRAERYSLTSTGLLAAGTRSRLRAGITRLVPLE